MAGTPDEIRAAIARIIAATPWYGEPVHDDGPPIEEPGEVIMDGTGQVGGRPRIVLGTDEFRCIEEAIRALTADADLYQRGRVLVRATQETRTDGVRRARGAATIETLPIASLRERLTRWAALVRRNDKGDIIDAHPPSWLVAGVDARGEWAGIRPLVAVSETPILRLDGSLCQTPGYDPATQVLYLPTHDFPPLPEDLDGEDAWRLAEQAARSLLDVVCDFRFESEAHKAAWLAALLTPLARHAFDGPSPLFLIDANIRGAGKGLLAQTIGRIVLGSEMPVSSYTHDPDELRKQITSIAMSGDSMILLDNIAGQFGNASLDRALTTTRWKDRVLGANKVFDGPLLTTWYATGNNVQIDGGSDTCRRIIHVRLDVLEEHPEERADFAHPDLVGWVMANRPRLLMDALAILAAYIRAGRPRSGLSALGSYVGWSDLVREAVVWVGLPDPCLTRMALAESSDTTLDVLGEFLAAADEWDWAHRGFVVADLARELYGEGASREPIADRMRNAVENLCGLPPGKVPSPKQLGNKLRAFRRRVCGGLFIGHDENYNRDGKRWRVFRVARVAEVYNAATLSMSCESVSGQSAAHPQTRFRIEGKTDSQESQESQNDLWKIDGSI